MQTDDSQTPTTSGITHDPSAPLAVTAEASSSGGAAWGSAAGGGAACFAASCSCALAAPLLFATCAVAPKTAARLIILGIRAFFQARGTGPDRHPPVAASVSDRRASTGPTNLRPLPERDIRLPRRQKAGQYQEPDLPLRHIPTPF